MDQHQQVVAQNRAREGTVLGGAYVFLSLVRPEYLPAVFSNCAAGWWLGGGGDSAHLLVVAAGALLVFLGGTFLSHAFRVSFERQHRRQNPLPQAGLGLRTVWRIGLVLMVVGTIGLQWPGRVTGGLAMALVFAVVLRSSMHRLLAFSPALLGVCWFLLYLLGASVATRGLTGSSIWCGLAIGLYVFGFESLRSGPDGKRETGWQLIALGAPVVLALLMNSGPYLTSAAVLCGMFLLWMLLAWWALGRVNSHQNANPNLFICGIMIVDMLAVCPAPMAAWQASQSAPRNLFFMLGGLFVSSLSLSLARAWMPGGASRVGASLSEGPGALSGAGT